MFDCSHPELFVLLPLFVTMVVLTCVAKISLSHFNIIEWAFDLVSNIIYSLHSEEDVYYNDY